MHVSRGGGGGSEPPTLNNHNNIGFVSNTGPDPLKITKLTGKQAFIGTPAKRHLNGVSLAGRCWSAYSGFLDPLIDTEQNRNQTGKPYSLHTIIVELRCWCHVVLLYALDWPVCEFLSYFNG